MTHAYVVAPHDFEGRPCKGAGLPGCDHATTPAKTKPAPARDMHAKCVVCSTWTPAVEAKD